MTSEASLVPEQETGDRNTLGHTTTVGQAVVSTSSNSADALSPVQEVGGSTGLGSVQEVGGSVGCYVPPLLSGTGCRNREMTTE